MENHLNMSNQFTTYEIALALKELGFDEECIGFYYNENNFEIAIPDVVKVICDKFNYIKAPLWQQVIEWFRNLHNIYIWISYSKGYDNPYSSYIITLNKTNGITTGYCKLYEESRKRVILKAIELCKTIHN